MKETRQKTGAPTPVSIARRQAILDHLNAHKLQTMHQISAALRCSQRTVSTYMREMKASKEVRIAGEHRNGKATTPLYNAMVIKTTQRMPKADTTTKVLSNVTKQVRPGHIQHLGTQRNHPLPDAGGQGRVSGGFGVMSTLGDGALSVALG